MDNIWAFEGWYFGGSISSLAISSDMKIEPLVPNAAGNQGLVNRQKIQLQQNSTIFHHILKNAVTRLSYTSFFPDAKYYMYTDVLTGRKIGRGLTRMKLMFDVIKPQLAVDHRTAEVPMEVLTLTDCQNNVRTFLTKQQENVLKINHLRNDGVKYDPQRFATLIFAELAKTTCADFLSNVKA